MGPYIIPTVWEIMMSRMDSNFPYSSVCTRCVPRILDLIILKWKYGIVGIRNVGETQIISVKERYQDSPLYAVKPSHVPGGPAL
jgi:hypothetical protein